MKLDRTMKNTNHLISLSLVLVLLCAPSLSQSQTPSEPEGPKTLQSQFQEILDNSESYTDYKVIRRTRLTEYSRAVQDSIRSYRTEINGLQYIVEDQKSQISSLSNRITDLESQLAESEELRESLPILGINLRKATYHWIVWIIIGLLTAFGIFAYTSYARSNRITSKTMKEYKALETEFEEHKKKSHEKQIKMGRELQTERNRVEELKTKLKAKAPGKI